MRKCLNCYWCKPNDKESGYCYLDDRDYPLTYSCTASERPEGNPSEMDYYEPWLDERKAIFGNDWKEETGDETD